MRGLQARAVSVRYGAQLAVEQVDITVDAEIVAILGPSGCGKSTLLRAIAGLEPLTGGRVLYDDADQSRIPVHRRGFGLMFQDGQLFEHLSVGGNVAYGLRRAGASRAAAAERAKELLTAVGLDGFDAREPATLSGGQRQRVALARSLAPRPRLLLLDEPLSALDRSLRTRLGADVRRLLTDTSTNALLVTHDHEEAFAVADRVAIMDAGQIVQTGTPRDVWAAPVDARTATFLGYDTVLAAGEGPALRSAFALGDEALALRGNALRVSDDGRLRGVVAAAVPALEELRIDVHLADGSEVGAVAPVLADLVPGDAVRLELDAAGIAQLP